MANSTWYSSKVRNVSRVSLNRTDGKINRYKTKYKLTLDDGTKIQFIHKQSMTMTGDMEYFYVTAKYEYRPDIISEEVYGSPLYAWAILAANNMKSNFDVVQKISIKIPPISEVLEGYK